MKEFKKGQCAKACKTCPWLTVNHNKRPDLENWYSTANLKRLWEGIRSGSPMICHSTDPEAINYGGTKEIKPGKEMHCVGSLVLVMAHANYLGKLSDQAASSYWKKLYSFTRHGLAAFAERMLFEKKSLPDAVDTQGISVPWEDNIVNRLEEKK